jgi:hypothetical protein
MFLDFLDPDTLDTNSYPDPLDTDPDPDPSLFS